MDNITHSLIGLALGKACEQRLSEKSIPPRFPIALIWAALIGSNLPDIDFLTTPVFGWGRLNYLLQHRGYTHSVIFSPFLAMASVFSALVFSGIRSRKDL